MEATTVRVWDPLIRLFHWSLVISFVAAWVTADNVKTLHLAAGYVGAGLVAIRILWGFVGTEYARFGQFVRGPGTVVAYLLAMLRREEPRHLGHNPAGALMILALLACMIVLTITGWLYTTDAFWGDEMVEEVHGATASIMLGLVGLHIVGVIFASLHQGENLVRSMITGQKPATIPAEDTGASVDDETRTAGAT